MKRSFLLIVLLCFNSFLESSESKDLITAFCFFGTVAGAIAYHFKTVDHLTIEINQRDNELKIAVIAIMRSEGKISRSQNGDMIVNNQGKDIIISKKIADTAHELCSSVASRVDDPNDFERKSSFPHIDAHLEEILKSQTSQTQQNFEKAQG